LQLLLSRYNHTSEEVRGILVHVLSQLAVKYPKHCAWWIYHFFFFDDGTAVATQNPANKKMIRRVDFAKEIFKTTTKLDPNATKQIMLSETLIGDLKKLCEKQPTKSNDTKMDIPRTLGQINFITELVMPIEENLQP
jgi:hypothetical protein